MGVLGVGCVCQGSVRRWRGCEVEFVIKVAGFNDPIVFIFPAAVASTAGSTAAVGNNEAVALCVFV